MFRNFRKRNPRNGGCHPRLANGPARHWQIVETVKYWSVCRMRVHAQEFSKDRVKMFCPSYPKKHWESNAGPKKISKNITRDRAAN